jgi:phosphoserine phosphatase
VPGFDVFACSEPADETGGDAYDVIGVSADGILIDPQTKTNATRLIMLIADATGHGIGPALSVTQVRAMLRMAARLGAPLAQIADHLNHQLCADLPSGRFVTAWLGEIDALAGSLAMLSAGQGPLLAYRIATDTFEEIDPDVFPFGIMPDVEFPQPTPMAMQIGDLFIAASDGFYEAMDPHNQLFGTQRVMDVIRAAATGSAADIAAALREAVTTFADTAGRGDDQTIVVIKRT